ncbi:hypothetical protein [Brevibacillus sp. SAFN-007a]|uniref:hypothetical protein n=1 Tax=Brevibacillus sp. SAFN-007a TaxID=3436862 RepID=UPI003F7EEB29
MKVEHSSKFVPIEPNLNFWSVLVAVVGTVSSIVTIYFALKVWTLTATLLAVASVTVPTLLILLVIAYNKLKSSSTQYNNLQKEYSELQKLHEALATRYDDRNQLIEDYKKLTSHIRYYLIAAISDPTEKERQQLLTLIELMDKLESNLRER